MLNIPPLVRPKKNLVLSSNHIRNFSLAQWRPEIQDWKRITLGIMHECTLKSIRWCLFSLFISWGCFLVCINEKTPHYLCCSKSSILMKNVLLPPLVILNWIIKYLSRFFSDIHFLCFDVFYISKNIFLFLSTKIILSLRNLSSM